MVSKRKGKRNNFLFYFAVCIIVLFQACATVDKSLSLDNPNELYQASLNALQGDEKGPDYDTALKRFKDFKEKYPKHNRAQEAACWIEVLEKLQALKKIELENIRE